MDFEDYAFGEWGERYVTITTDGNDLLLIDNADSSNLSAGVAWDVGADMGKPDATVGYDICSRNWDWGRPATLRFGCMDVSQNSSGWSEPITCFGPSTTERWITQARRNDS